jgi:LysM repeat protein
MRFFLLLAYVIVTASTQAFPLDSLRTETVNGNQYIIHRVDPQETLFALSRRYNVSVDDIKKNNPIAAEGLKIGDIIRIPYKVKIEQSTANIHVVRAGETLFSISKLYDLSVDDLRKRNALTGNELSIGQVLKLPNLQAVTTTFPVEKINVLPDTATYQWHVVRQGETLFSLSRMFNHEVSEIKIWNALTDNNINIGDSLIIGYSPKAKPVQPANDEGYSVTYEQQQDNLPKDEQPEKSLPENNQPKEEPVVVASTDEDVKVTKQIVTNEANYEEMVETGLAELIEDSGDTRKYLALHRTAKIGTIIRVKNEMNDREVFVRVLGKLPDTGINDKVLIKVSQAAFDRLNAIDKKFRVRISYFPD